MQTTTTVSEKKPPSRLKLNYLSHGTLESKDLDFARRFYEEFLGLDVIKTSEISLLIRLGGDNTIAFGKSRNKPPMNLLHHNGPDLETREDADHAYRFVVE